MLQLFKRNDVAAYIGVFFIAVICKLRYLLHPGFLKMGKNDFEASFFHLSSLHQLYDSNPRLFILAGLLIQLIFSYALSLMANRQKLFLHKNVIPSLMYVMLTSLLPVFGILSVAWFCNLFLFTAFAMMLNLNNSSHTAKQCFNIGMMISIASFFYIPAATFIFLLVFVIIFLRPLTFKEILAGFVGVFTPYYLLMAVSYLRGDFNKIINGLYTHIKFPIQYQPEKWIYLFGVIVSLLVVWSIIATSRNAYKYAIIIRKKWLLIQIYGFFAVGLSLVSGYFPDVLFLLAFTPISILLSQSLHQRNEKMNIFTFCFIVAALVAMQFILIK